MKVHFLKRLLTLGLVTTMMIGVALPVSAAEKNGGTTDVTIQIKGNSANTNGPDDPTDEDDWWTVTVPSVLPLVFERSGKTTAPTNWSVKNNDSSSAVYVQSMKLTGKGSWKVASATQDLSQEAINTTTIGFSMGKQGGTTYLLAADSDNGSSGKYEFGKGNEEISVEPGQQQVFDFNIARTAFQLDSDQSGSAYDLVLTFGFHGDKDVDTTGSNITWG